eukprot:TRINITY_DN12738_c0_g4_i2.p1 TRINITY_DN12738_c0_g4~~TRINITY_DN12738_c0_g4_i2.p1  ORF type:complete len:283 (-),score=40.34 TRINITY_DN12738_c0_g4_i2:127-975(-)
MLNPEIHKDEAKKKVSNLIKARSKLLVEAQDENDKRKESLAGQSSHRVLEIVLDKALDNTSAGRSNKMLNRNLVNSTITNTKIGSFKEKKALYLNSMQSIAQSAKKKLTQCLIKNSYSTSKKNAQLEALRIPSLHFALKKPAIAKEHCKQILNSAKPNADSKLSRNFLDYCDPVHKINLSVPVIEDRVLLSVVSKRCGLIPTLPIKKVKRPVDLSKRLFKGIFIPELRKERSFKLSSKTLFARRQESILKLRKLREEKTLNRAPLQHSKNAIKTNRHSVTCY